MKLNLIINHTSMEPIYEQIVAQIKAEVIEGRMTAGRCASIGEGTFKRAEDQCADSKKSL